MVEHRSEQHRAQHRAMNLTESEETEQQRIGAVQHALQSVILAVGERYHGSDLGTVEAALLAAIADAGIPEQPHKWVHDTAAEIAGGRLVVMNAREQELLGRPHEKVRRPVDPERDTTS
jgi:hypothetical protein